jgi:multicomponent K+:H+ antiporter subunit A
MALFKHDLKGLLAYSTISHLGLITLLFGMGTALAAVAAVFHIINHAIFKASLFMAAGIIDHETGSRDMRKLNGLWNHMPITATLAMVAAAAMAGVPLLNGFLSKEMFFTETLQQSTLGSISWMVPVFATIGAVSPSPIRCGSSTMCFLTASRRICPKRLMNRPATCACRSKSWWAVSDRGRFSGIYGRGVLAHASRVGVGRDRLPEYHLQIWHGLNLPLLMSLLAMLGGGASTTTGSGSSGFKPIFRSTTRASDSMMRLPGCSSACAAAWPGLTTAPCSVPCSGCFSWPLFFRWCR